MGAVCGLFLQGKPVPFVTWVTNRLSSHRLSATSDVTREKEGLSAVAVQ